MPAPHHSVFYRPDALPAAQPTASTHCASLYISGKTVSHAKMDEPTEMPFGGRRMWTQGTVCTMGCTVSPPGEYD